MQFPFARQFQTTRHQVCLLSHTKKRDFIGAFELRQSIAAFLAPNWMSRPNRSGDEKRVRDCERRCCGTGTRHLQLFGWREPRARPTPTKAFRTRWTKRASLKQPWKSTNCLSLSLSALFSVSSPLIEANQVKLCRQFSTKKAETKQTLTHRKMRVSSAKAKCLTVDKRTTNSNWFEWNSFLYRSIDIGSRNKGRGSWSFSEKNGRRERREIFLVTFWNIQDSELLLLWQCRWNAKDWPFCFEVSQSN
jgi:hypothetical protein